MKKRYLFILIAGACLCACGQHSSESYGFTNSKGVKQGEVADTPEEFMYEAITQGKDDQFNELIEIESNIELILKDGRTPLIQSVISDKAKYVHHLISRGAKVSAVDRFNKTSMEYAEELVRQRIKTLLDPQKQISQQEELFIAAKTGATKKVQDLLNEGANPNFVHSTGQTCLTESILSKKLLVVLTLLAWKDPDFLLTATQRGLANAMGQTPLDLAQQIEATKPADKKNKEKIINLLMETGSSD